MQLYEQAGVLEYWIVDPENQTQTQYRLGETGTFTPPQPSMNQSHSMASRVVLQ